MRGTINPRLLIMLMVPAQKNLLLENFTLCSMFVSVQIEGVVMMLDELHQNGWRTTVT